MAQRVYSCRVMSGRGASRIEKFTVPEHRRLVILAFGGTGWAAGTGQALQLKVHGIVIFSLNLVSGQTQFHECRLTAYARETVEMTIVSTDATYHCDGFMLDDDALEPDDAHNVITPLSMDHPEQLPGQLPLPLP